MPVSLQIRDYSGLLAVILPQAALRSQYISLVLDSSSRSTFLPLIPALLSAYQDLDPCFTSSPHPHAPFSFAFASFSLLHHRLHSGISHIHSSLVNIASTSFTYQALARLARVRFRHPIRPLLRPNFRYYHPAGRCSVYISAVTMSSSDEDIPLVKANGRSARESTPIHFLR